MTESILASVAVVGRQHDAVGALKHVERCISEYVDYSTCWTASKAAAGGHIKLLRKLYAAAENDKDKSGFSTREVETSLEAAAQNGHLEVVKFLHINFPDRGKTWALEFAATNGHLAVLTWLHEHGGDKDRFTMSAFDDAAENGHLEVVKWLHSNRREGCTTQAMDWAAQAGHLEVVQWLHENRNEGCSTMAIDSAASNGHLHLFAVVSKSLRRKLQLNHEDGPVEQNYSTMVKYRETTA
ncbi:hypothetical protein BBJ29_007564 [Phytophthora kernoviae]|uniref:Uncharacterized protein n=1 Tax=Phytophthora kernoviae TaxID=325452 RepID=A0A3F2RI79_9STRA|nr:hypothetical protein BBJ29_007564 [Phytophthora kernoviae]RLN57642.1 hypothetical protein BBP00_00007399 [Phytophthora kernoviae]